MDKRRKPPQLASARGLALLDWAGMEANEMTTLIWDGIDEEPPPVSKEYILKELEYIKIDVANGLVSPERGHRMDGMWKEVIIKYYG